MMSAQCMMSVRLLEKMTYFWLCVVVMYWQVVGSNSFAAPGAEDLRMLIESLASDNRPPIIPNSGMIRTPDFGADFKWDEQRRVRRVADDLLANIDKSWPALVDRMGDESYSLTLRFDAVGANLSVGELCRIMMSDSIAEAYRRFIPSSKEAHLQLRIPSIARNGFEFKEWCQRQVSEGRKLWEMQVAMCDWAKSEIGSVPGITDEENRRFVKDVDRVITELNEKHKCVVPRSVLVRDIRTLFLPEGLDQSK